MDIVLAGSGILVLAPLFLFLYAFVRWGPDGGPAFFGHRRVGLGGRTFMCYKFRTMATDGEARLSALLASDPELRRQWDVDHKLRADPRVTRIGRTLRKLSLDELPQLFNILRGDMSIVGPRPVVAAELVRYGLSADYYLSVRPGLTGLWQISGRNDTSYRKRIAFDRCYVSYQSLSNDVAIIAKTIPAVCFARGSY